MLFSCFIYFNFNSSAETEVNEIGEDTITAVKREMAEELGFKIKVKSLTAIAQNLFKKNRKYIQW